MKQSMINKEEVLSMLTSIQLQLEELERTIDFGTHEHVQNFTKEQVRKFKHCKENISELERKWKLVKKPLRKGRISKGALQLVSKLG